MSAIERFPNLVTMFFARAKAMGDTPFLWRKVAGQWKSLSWTEVAHDVAALASALQAQGLRPGDPVMLVSENRPEFCIADLAIMAAGCVTVPTYTTNTTRDHQHILTDSGARAVIVSTARLAQNLMPAVLRSQASFVIGMEPLRGMQGHVACHLWSDLIAHYPTDIDACAAGQTAKRDDLACIIYTSGTGGAPRGVMQHHGAILCNIEGADKLLEEDFGRDEEVFLSFLPLSHAYEHSGGQFLPIMAAGQIYYAEGLEKLASNIEEARPTIMVVVPRLFEVLRARIIKSVEKQGKFPTYLLGQALRIAAREQRGRKSLLDLPMKALLARTLKPKIAARFGGRMKALVSGGAPLNPDVGLFFDAMGLTLLQGYGQTEAGPVISCNRPRAGIAMDTVGPPLDGVEVRIAEDGEILVRGELVMHGYWRNPAETEKALQNGWLHTGDIGEIDEKGRIRITDRKKDLIVNDKGDNVSPQKVEGMLTLQPEIGQAMVYGDRRPHLVGLLVPDAEWTREWAQAQGRKVEGIAADPAYQAALRAAVDRVNDDLSVIERVRRFILADEPFTIDNSEMTPSMKIRRHVIRARYQERLDALYKG
ncbi:MULTISPECIES: AMP-dependent synthetase/ligase [Sphingobium]|uniref:AMP-dependent synthetase n=1 Tax=Sphingobium fuliginis (strain ATCC 27551) TaxID=336203 RepID=A0ABQ1FBC6_SPHSA|nr:MULTISPECIES: AMP-dependent synthetase/ligase [Sphingobium]AJR23117.1 AMP-dependent synthetase [Sphingobium sp. YBL2]UXC90209.1 AMP-dependent synthetase/ligase [Sphingobium sp. RSMS]WDA34601.1 AMP-dependent synthetase/ligase [Sphingobium sp. YC-XJ3]GGA04806.1 AMP-dependent synthetase [Sphingobium fuliginis]